ncbi:MAG: FkbM family methyltransferase [Azonexus sp.]|nr:FkbM family methyltransferase [Azonexus sp.]
MSRNIGLPLVSVGIPTYNRPEGLRRTLACIAAQTYRNLEIVVSDNCSPSDDTEAVVRDFMAQDPRISYFKQSVNRGPWGNFLFVLERSCGEYFMWAADDDEWEPNFVSRCLSEMTGVGSVMCEFETVFRAKGLVEKNPLPCLGKTGSTFLDVSRFLSLMQPTLIYGLHRRSDIQFALSEKGFDFYDCYFVLRLILGSGVRTIGGVSYRAGVDAVEYCVKPANQTSGQLNYWPFARQVMWAILACKKLVLREKMVLSVRFLVVLAGLVVHHERSTSPRCTFVIEKVLGGGVELMKSLRNRVSGFLVKLKNRNVRERLSYAQSGEDLIVDFIFRAMRMEHPSYLDIGAHHPTHFSNTYFFYKSGSVGVTVEPDPTLFRQLRDKRPKDVHLNVGVGEANAASLPFYVMSTKTLNSFSKEEAERYQATGMHRIDKILNIPVVSIGDVLSANFPDRSPDFLSVDVEGLDFQILKAIDFSKYRPIVVCVETITFSENRQEKKVSEIIEYMCNNGYFVYADTYINSIFVDREKWQGR